MHLGCIDIMFHLIDVGLVRFFGFYGNPNGGKCTILGSF